MPAIYTRLSEQSEGIHPPCPVFPSVTPRLSERSEGIHNRGLGSPRCAREDMVLCQIEGIQASIPRLSERSEGIHLLTFSIIK